MRLPAERGFFSPAPCRRGSACRYAEATSFYDTGALRRRWRALSILTSSTPAETRFSIGAVNVRTGNFTYFDSTTHTIGPEHVMASGALPPSFPPIEIEGEYYWDGGVVSNTPLEWVTVASPVATPSPFRSTCGVLMATSGEYA